MNNDTFISLLDYEYQELLNRGFVSIYRELGVSIYEKRPIENSEYDYEMYILRADEKEDKNDMYPTLCKLLLNHDAPFNKISYIENPFGRVGDILTLYCNNERVVVECTESSVTSLMRNNLNAHGLGNDREIIGKFIKSKSYISSDSLRFIIYCWYNQYTILHN